MKYIMCKYDEAYTKKEVKEECPVWCEKCTLECEYAKRSNALVAIPNNVTNGDMLKALCPKIKVESIHDDFVSVWFGRGDSGYLFPKYFWDAPYKKE